MLYFYKFISFFYSIEYFDVKIYPILGIKRQKIGILNIFHYSIERNPITNKFIKYMFYIKNCPKVTYYLNKKYFEASTKEITE